MAESEGAEPVIVEIDDEDELYRRLASDHVTNGEINSAAFKYQGQPRSSTPVYQSISVDLAKLTTQEETLGRAHRPGFGLGVLVAGEPRLLGFSVRHDPEPEHEAHSLIEGANDREKCRRLAEATRILVQPAGS